MAPSNRTPDVTEGLRAGLALFAHRPDDIVRVVHSRAVRAEIRALLQWAGSRGVPCAEMGDHDIDRFAESSHHEGLCVVAQPRSWASAQDLGARLASSAGVMVALDRVRNPYNVGAILRSAAFFNVEAVLLGAPAPHSGLPPLAVRVAEGGAEAVVLARTTDLAETLARLKARGARIVGADAAGDVSIATLAAERRAGPLVLVLGNEREGLADRVREQCHALVSIRGSGRVESLNVGVAAGILISAMASSGGRPPEEKGLKGREARHTR